MWLFLKFKYINQTIKSNMEENFYNQIGMNVMISKNEQTFWNEVISVIDETTLLCKVHNEEGSLVTIHTDNIIDYLLPGMEVY